MRRSLVFCCLLLILAFGHASARHRNKPGGRCTKGKHFGHSWFDQLSDALHHSASKVKEHVKDGHDSIRQALEYMPVKRLKNLLRQADANLRGVVEKSELVDMLCRLTPGCEPKPKDPTSSTPAQSQNQPNEIKILSQIVQKLHSKTRKMEEGASQRWLDHSSQMANMKARISRLQREFETLQAGSKADIERLTQELERSSRGFEDESLCLKNEGSRYCRSHRVCDLGNNLLRTRGKSGEWVRFTNATSQCPEGWLQIALPEASTVSTGSPLLEVLELTLCMGFSMAAYAAVILAALAFGKAARSYQAVTTQEHNQSRDTPQLFRTMNDHEQRLAQESGCGEQTKLGVTLNTDENPDPDPGPELDKAIKTDDKGKRRCKESGRLSICQHEKQRSLCKGCGGSTLCDMPDGRPVSLKFGCDSIPDKAVVTVPDCADKEHCVAVKDEGLVRQLEEMGFSDSAAILTALTLGNGHLSTAALMLSGNTDSETEAEKPLSEDNVDTDGSKRQDEEWPVDPLQELEQMGFTDAQANKTALADANGVLTVALKNLIAEERANQ